MHKKDVLLDIVRNIPTDRIPIDYITMVKLKDREGNRYLVKGPDIVDFFRGERTIDSVETKLVIDHERIYAVICREVDYIFEEVERMQRARFNN